jgi:hypothetical protein
VTAVVLALCSALRLFAGAVLVVAGAVLIGFFR